MMSFKRLDVKRGKFARIFPFFISIGDPENFSKSACLECFGEEKVKGLLSANS
jgi:hypothetical protein